MVPINHKKGSWKTVIAKIGPTIPHSAPRCANTRRRDAMQRVRFAEIYSEEGLDKFCRSTIRGRSWKTVFAKNPAYHAAHYSFGVWASRNTKTH